MRRNRVDAFSKTRNANAQFLLLGNNSLVIRRRNAFIEGLLCAFTFGMYKKDRRTIFNKKNEDALKEDWNAVGRDMWMGIVGMYDR